MTTRAVLLVALAAAVIGAGIGALLRGGLPELQASGARPPAPGAPGGQPIDAALIGSGRLALERLPEAVTGTLQAHSEELVRTSRELQQKQARITGTCAPGSAIRIIGEDGSVSCQKLPRGVISVSALAGVPRLSGTTTAQGSVPGGVGRYQTAGEDDFLVVPVPLPDGAVVTGFSYAYYDAHPAVDGVAYLYRSDDQPLAVASSAGAADAVRVATTDVVQLARVDTGRYAYFVYFQVSREGGANLVPVSASVAYRLP